MRRAAKVDSNQKSIVDALRKIGCKVQSLAAVGSGVPDLLISRHGRLMLLEVKDGSKVPSARQLTDDQKAWHAEWAGAPVVVVETVEQAIAALGAI